ncbi:MAG: twin-arginine translocase TatA/TatE family subunit [Bacteroidota bacterium]
MKPFVLLGMPGGAEILIILVVLLLLFGGRKIPELMKGIGQGMREFKKATKGEDEEKSSKSSDKELEKGNI